MLDVGVVVLNSVCPVKTSPGIVMFELRLQESDRTKVDSWRYAFFPEEITTKKILRQVQIWCVKYTARACVWSGGKKGKIVGEEMRGKTKKEEWLK